tara:strand:+ start:33 stop:323 length:291 start_codon:yes stop_codon:yes gene_type:complete
MKTRILKKIISKKLITTNSEIYGITDVNLFGGGQGKKYKTILLDQTIYEGDKIQFVGYTIDEARVAVIHSDDVETIEGMQWKKFAEVYGLLKQKKK